jgi:uncharacterized membrane protein YqjE
MEGAATAGVIGMIFLSIVGFVLMVLLVLMPWFVYRTYCHSAQINDNTQKLCLWMKRISEQLEEAQSKADEERKRPRIQLEA